MQFSDAIWWRHNKSKMADGRHIENGFLVISRRHIGRSTRNLEQKWRITCRYRSRDQKSKASPNFSALWGGGIKITEIICHVTVGLRLRSSNTSVLTASYTPEQRLTPYYLRREGYVSAFVGLSVSRITQTRCRRISMIFGGGIGWCQVDEKTGKVVYPQHIDGDLRKEME